MIEKKIGRETDRREAESIWAKELKIFENRAAGSMEFYLSIVAENFMAWPAWAGAPVEFADMVKKFRESETFEKGEKIIATMKGIAIDGDTAQVFFQTHRTQLPGGEQANERFNNIHVWVRRAGDWRLFSNMSYPFTGD